MKTSRRQFLGHVMVVSAGVAPALLLSRNALAADEKVSESDPTAKSLGYVEDAARADKARFPIYAAGQSCGTCSLFQGKSGDAWGSCVLFGTKLVASGGWCSSYTNS
ncbi:high-potential iron-sulfur protein [Paraburkholderia kururiensis]|uniref:High-potential iron-sulfur protein n=1 Tax=Paraburkholderia kururiensis TaxID=984307 RepID=A0ABZ0WMR7_9BURK|nr:high-potential iron-sulfur protein [Paraburkholderia kururiensis]WQD78619.1 high-potential iron-sulfur protein [Paraburkholderia kururiensis]